MTAEQQAAMQAGRERALEQARAKGRHRVAVYREWLRLDAAYYTLRRNGDLTFEQYHKLRPAVPEIPTDSDYAAVTT